MRFVSKGLRVLATFWVALPSTVVADDIMTIRRFEGALDSVPDVPPIAEHRWKLTQLDIKTCTEGAYVAGRSSSKLSIEVTTERLDPSARRLGFDANTIDGQPSMGHDGLVSPEYVATNLAQALVIKNITARFGNVAVSIPRRQFTYMLRPWLTNGRDCSTVAFWAPDQRLIVLRTSGGDGAGAYVTYLLFSATGFKGQYVHEPSGPDFFGRSSSVDYFHPEARQQRTESITITLDSER